MVHPVGQQTHLGVAAIAGVLAQDIREGDYLLEGHQHRATKDVPTPSAACELTAKWAQLIRLTCRANEVAGPGCLDRNLHLESFHERVEP